MTEISGFLQGQIRTAQDGGSSITGSLSTSPTGAAQAWKREMERQQQRTWFLPPLPTTDGEPDFRMVASNSAGMAAREAHPVAGARQKPLPQGLVSTTQAKFTQSEVRTSEVAYGHAAGGPLLKNMGIADPQKEAVPAALLRDTRSISPVWASSNTNWMQVTATGSGSTVEDDFNVDVTTDGAADIQNKVSPATARPTSNHANSASQPPLRVSCGWQNDQLTVWIGHDRGQGDVAAKLVQTIDRWLVTKQLPPAAFVINGEPLRRDGFLRDVVNSANEGSSNHLPGRVIRVIDLRTYADLIPKRNI